MGIFIPHNPLPNLRARKRAREERRGEGKYREMAFDPLLQTYDAGQLNVTADFFTHWLSFLTSDRCDGCPANLRCRIPGSSFSSSPSIRVSSSPISQVGRFSSSGSAPPAITSSNLRDANPRGFESTGWDPDPSSGPTGWDTKPEWSSGSNETRPPAELGRAPVVPTGWLTEPDFEMDQTPAPTGWDFGSESGWDINTRLSSCPPLIPPPERKMYGLFASSSISGSRLSKPVFFVSAGIIYPESPPAQPNRKMMEAGKHEQQREQRKFMGKYSIKSLRMMVNQGFQIGNGLGKNEDGILVPIQIRPHSTRTGLGYTRESKNLPDLSPPTNEKYHVESCEQGIIRDLERLQI